MSSVAGSHELPVTAHRPLLVGAAWTAMLLLSRLPQIVAVELFGWEGEIVPWWLGTALLLVALTFWWTALRPLRAFLVVMAFVVLFTGALPPVIQAGPAWQAWFPAGSGLDPRFFGSRLLLVLAALALALLLRLLGYRRRDFFLVAGDPRAPFGPSLPGMERPLPWLPAGLLVSLLLAGLFSLALAQMFPPPPGAWARVGPLLPTVALLALMNAFGEEMAYRAAPLAPLLPIVGGRQAIWITSIWFGLGHYYGGIPSGPAGAIASGLLALLFGRAMLATRGIALPILMHLIIDTAIYTFLALATNA